MSINQIPENLRPSTIIKTKLQSQGGNATVISITKKPYDIIAHPDHKSFLCKELPISPPYEYSVFDIIVSLLLKQGGKAIKGGARNYKVGHPKCDETTVVGIIAIEYFGKTTGTSTVDPVFVLSAILEWAGIVHNERGYIQLTSAYKKSLNI